MWFRLLKHLYGYAVAAVIASVMLFHVNAIQAQSTSSTQLIYNLQVHMLFKLLPYIDWVGQEDQTEEPFVICILGDDPYGKLIDQLAKESQYKKRKIEIRRIEEIDQLQSCHVLFINPSFENDWNEIQEKIKTWQILTISEYGNFAKLGGMVNYFINNDNLNLEINVTAVEEKEIKINSLVLQLKKVKVIRN